MNNKNSELEKAKKELDEFLKQHPHLQEFQNEIDRNLKRAGTYNQRMEYLKFMIECKSQELDEKLNQLREEVTRYYKTIEDNPGILEEFNKLKENK